MFNSNNEMNVKNCTKCGLPSAMMCQRCFEPYCSVECQVTDWRDHKLNCVEMPRLVSMDILGTLAAKSTKNSNAKMPNRTSTNHVNHMDKGLSSDVYEKNGNILPDTWRNILSPPTSGIFQVLVQFIEVLNDGTATRIWLTQAQNQKTLQNLLQQMERQVRFNESIKVDAHSIGSLVVANNPDRPYRGEIISLQAQNKQATIRLIDRGNTITIGYDEIYAANQYMASLQALAFGAIICPCLTEPIERYSLLKIRLTSVTPTTDGFYKVEICTPKPQAPTKTMSKHPSIKLLKALDGEFPFLLLQQLNNIQHYEKQHQILQNTYNASSVDKMEAGEIVAACIENTWHRALLLAAAINDNIHLVYLCDEGRVRFCSKINKLSLALATELPPRVIIVQLEKNLPNNIDNSSIVLMTSDNQPDDDCIVHIGDFVAKAKLVTPLSLFDDAKYGYWLEKPTNNSIVRITDNITHAIICVSASDLSLFSKILMRLADSCALLKAGHALQQNDLVLAQYTPSKFMRGTVISTSDDKTQLLDVDTGIIRTAPRDKLRHATPLVCALPSQLAHIKLDLLRDIPTVPTDSSALKYLRECIEQKIEFKLVFEDESSSIANLISCNKPYTSLNKQLLPLLFQNEEPALPCDLSQMNLIDKPVISISKSLATPKPLSAATKVSASENNSTASIDFANNKNTNEVKTNVDANIQADIKIAPLPEGDGVELFVIDSSAFGSKILTVAFFDGGKVVNEFNRTLELTLNFVQNATPKQRNYEPRINELCLAIFKDDGEWYRARCLKSLNDKSYMVEFFDYGNCSEVSAKDIIGPLTEELCYPKFTHNCELTGVSDMAALQKALAEKPLLLCQVAKIENKYYITPQK